MKYRKKSVKVDAWQFTKKNFSKGAPEFIRHAKGKPVTLYSQYGGEVIYGEIETLEGIMHISENDYIIKGVSGEIYACKPDIFMQTYEIADTEEEYQFDTKQRRTRSTLRRKLRSWR